MDKRLLALLMTGSIALADASVAHEGDPGRSFSDLLDDVGLERIEAPGESHRRAHDYEHWVARTTARDAGHDNVHDELRWDETVRRDGRHEAGDRGHADLFFGGRDHDRGFGRYCIDPMPPVPEPAAVPLAIAGLAFVGLWRRRRARV